MIRRKSIDDIDFGTDVVAITFSTMAAAYLGLPINTFYQFIYSIAIVSWYRG